MRAQTTSCVAANLRAEVARRRIPQRELAQVLECSQQSMSRRLQGTQPLTVDELMALSAFLDMDPAVLLDGAKEPAA